MTDTCPTPSATPPPATPPGDDAAHSLRRPRATAPRATSSGSARRTTRPTTARSPTSPPTSTTAAPSTTPRRPRCGRSCARSGCPVAHSDRYGGMWVPLTHDTVHDVAYDTENFTQPQRRRQHHPSRRPRAAGADRWCAADHQRPAVPQRGPPPAAAAVRAEADRAVGARDPRAVPASCSTRWARSSPARPSSTPRSSTPRTSRST